MHNVTIVTDGACSGNPGPGGWCAILFCKDRKKVLQGNAPYTTNNQMELKAIVSGLHALNKPCNVTIETDSAYIVNQVNGGHLDKWASNGWLTANNEPVCNQALWYDILMMRKKHNITFVKVKGHADNVWNNKADLVACKQRDMAKIFHLY